MATRGAQVGGRALARGTRRRDAASAARSCPRLHRPLAIGLSAGLQTLPSLCAETAESKRVPSPATLRRAGRLRDGTDEVHSQAPLPRSRAAPRRGRRRSSSPGSGFPGWNHRTSQKSGPQDPVSASATSDARDLCPGRKRKRAGSGAPTPCRGGPGRRAHDFLQVHVHPGAVGRAPRARTCSAQPSGAPWVAGGMGAARWRGPGHNGSRRAGAGTARARPPRGRSSGAARAPNAAAAAAWHRRSARPVHANGRRPRHELFSSGAERVSAARRAARPARPPPLRSRRGDFPNFRRSAPRMLPPRLLRPRPSAPAALPPLPPILCLLSRSWHLSQRARFPAHPFAAGSGRGRGHGGPGKEGTEDGGSKAPTVPAARRARPGATAVPACPGASVPRGGQGFGCAQNTNEASRGPGPCPQWARTGRGPSPTPPFAAHPPPGAGARGRGGRGGRREQRIRRPGPAPRPAAPRARPRGHAAPGAPRPRAPGPRPRPPPRAGQAAPRCRAPAPFCFAPRGPRA